MLHNIQGFESLAGQRITVFAAPLIWTGRLAGMNDGCILLEEPAIVYLTGPFDDPNWEDAQPLPSHMYIQKAAIQAYGVVK